MEITTARTYSSNGEEVEDMTAVPPGIGVAILSLALVCKECMQWHFGCMEASLVMYCFILI